MKHFALAILLVFVLVLPAAAQRRGPASRMVKSQRPTARRQVQNEHRVIYGRPGGYFVRSWFFNWQSP